jgi:hypothetical protein
VDRIFLQVRAEDNLGEARINEPQPTLADSGLILILNSIVPSLRAPTRLRLRYVTSDNP